jgi:hypothetical protein
VLILDCCYSGAFARGASVRGDRAVHIAEEFGSGTGRIVLTASSATEYAFEGDELTPFEAGPSVFTEALVSGLRTGGADLDGDGEISVDELYEYAFRRVREHRSGQEPRKWTFGMAGPLVLARSTRPAVLPEDIRADLASERVVLRLEAVTALAALLSGGKPGLRDAASAALVGLRDNDDSVRVRTAAASALGGTVTPSPVDFPEPVPIPVPVAEPVPAPAPAPVPARVPEAPRPSWWLTPAGWLAIAGALLWFLALAPDERIITRRYVPDMDEPFFLSHLATFGLVLVAGVLVLAVRRRRSVLSGCLVAIGPWMLHRAGYLLIEPHLVRDHGVGWWLDLLAVLTVVAAGACAVRGLLPETGARARVPLAVAVWTYLVVGVIAALAVYTSTDPSVDILVCVASVAVAVLALRWRRAMATAALATFGLFAVLQLDWTGDWSGRVLDRFDDPTGWWAIASLLVFATAALVWFTASRAPAGSREPAPPLDERYRRFLTVAAWLTLAAVLLPLMEVGRYWGSSHLDDMDEKVEFWLGFGNLPLMVVAAVAVLVRPGTRTAGLLLGILSWAVADRFFVLGQVEDPPITESAAHLLVAAAAAGVTAVLVGQARRTGIALTRLWFAVPAAVLGAVAGLLAYASYGFWMAAAVAAVFAGVGVFALAGPAVPGGWVVVALPVGVLWFVVSGTEDEPLLFTAIVLGYAALIGWMAWRSRKVEAHP